MSNLKAKNKLDHFGQTRPGLGHGSRRSSINTVWAVRQRCWSDPGSESGEHLLQVVCSGRSPGHSRPRGHAIVIDRLLVPGVQRLDSDDQRGRHELPIAQQRPLCRVLVLELQVQEVRLRLAEGAPLQDVATLAELLCNTSLIAHTGVTVSRASVENGIKACAYCIPCYLP